MTSFNFQNSVLRICVDSPLRGEIRAVGLPAPLPFADGGSLVLRIEEILDRRNYPQAFQRSRRFAPAHPAPAAEGEAAERGFTLEEVTAASGRAGAFSVHVVSRQSATWQGSVDWLDGTPPTPFSSDLEFLRLVDARFPSAG